MSLALVDQHAQHHMRPPGAMGAQKGARPQPPAPASTDTDCYQVKVGCCGTKKENKNGNENEDENEKIKEKEKEKEKDLDSGYAWLILLIMFLLQSSIAGSSRVYGIVYAREVATGYYDREQASWPIATASAVENLAGILTPALAQFMSWRQMELMSTSLFVMANLLAYYSQSLALDIVALGLVQGLALSTCTVLSLVINNDYFERYRTTAYGIQMSGSTFGVLYLSPLVTWILETHDGPTNFRLVYLALACVFCFNLILVLFIKPRRNRRPATEATKAPNQQQQQQFNQDLPQATAPAQKSGFGLSASRKVSRFESHFERKSSIASVSYGARSRRQSILSRVVAAPPPGPTAAAAAPVAPPRDHTAKSQAQLAKSKSGIELARAGSRAHELKGRESLMKKISLCSMRHDVRDISHQQRSSVVSGYGPEVGGLSVSRQGSLSNKHPQCAAGKTTHTFLLDADADVEADTASLASCNTDRSALVELDLSSFSRLIFEASKLDVETKMGETHELDEKQKTQQFGAQQMRANKPAGEVEEEKFSLQLVKRMLALPYLHCTWIMLALYYLIARILVIILVDFAHDHGHSLADATELLNYWSLGELIGRVLLGSLIDLKFLSCKSCIALVCTTVGALLTLMVLVQSYLIYATCSLLIAALISLEYMLINVMMVEYLGEHRVTSCYSLAACLSSAVLFARPSMIGLFRDHLGTYDGLLLLLAGLAVTFALLFYLLEPLFVRRWPKCAA